MEYLEYRFGDYRLSNREQVLYKNGDYRSVSTKLYYLLLLMVENAGQVISKQKIIDTVWPGQVVTDTALAKQVLRLRKLIKDHDRDQPYIETHRGVGYRFVAPVTVTEKPANDSSTAGVRRTAAWPKLVGAAVLVMAAVGLWHTLTREEITAASSDPAGSIKVAVLPLQNSQDWLNQGGREYLATRLGEDPRISSVSPPTEWLAEGSADTLAIDLTAEGNLTYSLLVGLSQSDATYQAEVRLRNEDGVVSSDELQADSLPLLFDRADAWVRNSISAHAQLQDLAPRTTDSVDDYALQSYLLGMFELAANDNKKKAGEYFQAAVSHDPDFLEAWTRLAENHMALGEFNDAISIAQTLMARSEVRFSPELLLKLNYVIGVAYGRLQNEEESLRYLSRTRELITESNDPYVQLTALDALFTLAVTEQRFEDAKRLAEQSLTLAEENYYLPNYLANIHLNLARALDRGGTPDQALPHIQEAINLWHQTDNANGLMKGYHLLTNYHFQMGNVDEGIQVLIQGDPYLDRASVAYEKAFYLQNGGLLLNLRGQFVHAREYAERLSQLAFDTDNPMYLLLSKLVEFHQLYVQERYSDAADHALATLAKFEAEGTVQSAFPDLMALAILTSARGKPPAVTHELIAQFDARFPDQRERLRNDLRRAEAHLAIRAGQVDDGLEMLKDTEAFYRGRNLRHVADYIATERLEVLLAHLEREYEQLLSTTEASAGYGYLLWKLKAQFLAREGNYFEAARIMAENKLRANQLWTAEDQLLLESYQRQSDS